MTEALARFAKKLGRFIPRTRLPSAGKEGSDFDGFLKSCARIVHVGANSGQERDLYNRYDLTVIWIEPIPAVYEQLACNIQPYPKQRAIQALLTDRAGDTVQFNIASNSGQSSSILHLALHKDIWPQVSYVDKIEIRTETLDRLLAAREASDSAIDALVLDTQGSELLVLKGAQAVLRQVKFVKVEAADFEAYEECATVNTIKEFLSGFSLRLVGKNKFAGHPSGGGYYDLLFERRSVWSARLRAVKGLRDNGSVA